MVDRIMHTLFVQQEGFDLSPEGSFGTVEIKVQIGIPHLFNASGHPLLCKRRAGHTTVILFTTGEISQVGN